ncbi:MAG: hypothetical protein PHQ36_11830 [Anaerolineales bacterium]|nr:hypothetical protein [Anaerolineales bacterium]
MTTKTARKVFLVVFILSTIFGVGLLFSPVMISSPAATHIPAPPPDGSLIQSQEEKSSLSSNMTLVASFATSLASLVGFVMTTAITWRKEKRESALAEIQRKKLELELEKSRLELDELKKKK